ncbi:hypothetical protein L9F63_012762, partial [Diploptera punctata]
MYTINVDNKKILKIKPCNILYWLKPLYLMSKYVGLAPFKLTEDLVFQGNLQSLQKCDMLEFVWPILLFLLILCGFVYCILNISLKSENPGLVAHEFVVPLNYITALTTLLLNLTTNRLRVQQLMHMIRKVDSILYLGKCKLWYKKARLYLITELTVLFLLCIPFLCYDAYYWAITQKGCHYEFVKRLSVIIALVVVIHFSNIMYFFKHRLLYINELLMQNKHETVERNTLSNSTVKFNKCTIYQNQIRL